MFRHPFKGFFIVLRLALLVACLGAVSRADDDKHPIDLWLKKALDRAASTADTRHALQTAEAKWDQEMNRAYKTLMRRLDRTQRAMLLRSQKAWLAFRDAEIQTSDAIVGSKQGTMWLPVIDEKHVDLVKARALQLADYDRLLDE